MRSAEVAEQFNNGAWLSLVERCVRDAEVVGSNPVAPTSKKRRFSAGLQAVFSLSSR